MSTRLQERRREAQYRAMEERAAAAGLTLDAYHAAIQASYLAWSLGAPWRWLPRTVRGQCFDHFGRRHAARFVAAWSQPIEELAHAD